MNVSRRGTSSLSVWPGLALMTLAALVPESLRAQDPPEQPEPPKRIQPEDLPDDLSRLSLEELMQIEVTTLSKRNEKMFRTPAAVYVITAEEIRRSGLRGVAELLRLVPGVEVASYDANKWAVSARGFNARFSNKLQVLIDGRSVYTPTFSGVLWDTTSLDVDDIDRIEVIRGPGATVWGANAVNGVINIITKRAPKDAVTRFEAFGGTDGEYRGQVHIGGPVDEHARFRATIQGMDHDGFVDGSNDDADDDWAFLRGDFRLDWAATERDAILIMAGAYDGGSDSRLTLPTIAPVGVMTSAETTEVHGGYALGRWTRDLGGGEDWSLQFYFNTEQRHDIQAGGREDTFDLDFRHHFFASPGHEIVWGLGARLIRDDVRETFWVTFDDPKRTSTLFSGFIQDQIALADRRLFLTVGIKIEDHEIAGFEYEPGARLLWTPDDQTAVWASITRAVRTPSRAEEGVHSAEAWAPGPILVVTTGNPGIESENLRAYEAGIRRRLGESVTIDVAAFLNQYRDLIVTSPGVPFMVLPLNFMNGAEGETAGAEVLLHVVPDRWWKLTMGYSILNLHELTPLIQGSSPRHRAFLRSYLDLSKTVKLDVSIAYVDRLAAFDISSYTRADVRLGWRPGPGWEISVGGRNLLDPHHPEFGNPSPTGAAPTEVERSIFVAVSYQP